jgi:LDH2 family malate/lactate/ureidoglycolate dehydrogenase
MLSDDGRIFADRRKTMIVSFAELKGIAIEILIRAGGSEANADCVAAHLANANLAGVDTHGVWQLPGYVAAIERGELLPRAIPALLLDQPAAVQVTGNWGFGQVAALEALEQVTRKARACGIAVASVVQSHHIGRLGEYAERAAGEGLISMIWASGLGEVKADVVPYGGRTPVFGTNPLGIGLPVPGQSPIVIDFATSATSGVKIIEAIRKGAILPAGMIVDKAGAPTTDPEQVRAGGGQIPFGGHKGYSLMFAIEVLGRICSGADSYVKAPMGGVPFSHQGVTMIALKADLFQSQESYLERTSELRERVRAVPPAPGFTAVSVPGDPEMRARAVRERDGIPIPDGLWQNLLGLAARDAQVTSASSIGLAQW